MAVVQESNLSASQKDSVKRAHMAVQRNNFDYAITLLQQVLKECPEFFDGRKMLRDTCIKKNANAKGFLTKSLSAVQLTPNLVKAQAAAKRSPQEAMVLIEHVLAIDPFHSGANSLLCDVAKGLQMMETACFALETIRQGNPKDVKNLHHLGELYASVKDPRARDAYQAVLDINPLDGEAQHGMKSAEAQATLSRGWETASNFRDVIANKDEANKLEQASKLVKSDEAIDGLIAELYAKQQAEPTNVLHVKRIAELYMQKKDLPNALSWYQYAFEVAGRMDPGIEKIIYEIQMKQMDESIKQWSDYLESIPADAPDRAEHQATLDGICKQRQDMLLDEVRKRVQKYPNDLQYRFDLGEALYRNGDVEGAIPELQQSLRQPNVRQRAMMLVGLCFKAKGQLDIASKRLEEAVSEAVGMDEIKKGMLYELALIYEQMSQKEKYVEALKKIYEVDYAYRDVAKRVETSY